MKICTKCGVEKPLDMFYRDNKLSGGYVNSCKICQKEIALLRSRTKEGLISEIYSSQKSNSKVRGDDPPSYSLSELKDWALSKPEFHLLYNAWVDSGYETNIIPSFDRSNDNYGYSLQELSVTTWEKNRAKLYSDRLSGKHTKTSKKVNRLDMNGEFIEEHYSISSASRRVGVSQSKVSECCIGLRKSTRGFKFEYAD